MKDVMTEVDKIMDNKVKKNHKYVTSSDSSDDYVILSFEDSEVEAKKGKSKKRAGKTSGKC